jgi:predicted nucleotidyltransferase component of viral defense system
MLSAYDLSTVASAADAIREIIQEIALLGLSRSAFFKKAAFYGGTALRIFYGLDRYSEDMDFSLLHPDASFDLNEYAAFVVNELAAFGFEVSFEKRKKKAETRIESAFLKANTKAQFLVIENARALANKLPKGQAIRIKLEIDTDPPPDFSTEIKYHLRPLPFPVNVYALPDLFSGKMHALLCRDWKRRVKGRDWYDFVWYVSRDTPLRLSHLDARMLQSGHKKWTGMLTPALFRKLIKERIDALDDSSAKDDVVRFLPNSGDTSIWSKSFFIAVAEKIRCA